MANRNRSSRRGNRRPNADQVRNSADGVQIATSIAVAECDDCGGGIIVLVNENSEVFAQAHFPSEPADWLTDDFIPTLMEAVDNQRAVGEAAIRVEYSKSLFAGIPLEIEWSEHDVRRTILDARNTGVGGFPKIVSDNAWIKANAKMIEELGAEPYLRRLLDSMHQNFSEGD